MSTTNSLSPTTGEVLQCQHVTQCSGCTSGNTPYPQQLVEKFQRLVTALQAYPTFATKLATATVAATPTEQYRTRVKLPVQIQDKSTAPHIGLYARQHPGTVLDIPHCQVMTSAVAGLVQSLRMLPFPTVLAHLHAVDVRDVLTPEQHHQLLLTLIFDDRFTVDLQQLHTVFQHLQSQCPTLAGLGYAIHQRNHPQVLGGTPTVVTGPSYLRDQLTQSVYVHTTHGSFIQAHRSAARNLYHTVLTDLQTSLGTLAGKRVLDLYSGTGAIALLLAKAQANVTAIEAFAPAIALLQQAAREQELSVHTIAGSVDTVLPTTTTVDIVYVNPPRRGLTSRTRLRIAQAQPQRIGYLACEPYTLARDLAHWQQLGFTLEKIAPFDLMPHTTEVETWALLRAGSVPKLEIIAETEQAVAVAKPAYTPITPQRDYPTSVIDRLRLHPAHQHAVAVLPTDNDSSGVYIAAKNPKYREQLQQALLQRSTRSYLALCKGVTHPKGTLKNQQSLASYQRREVIAGHSLVQLQLHPHTETLTPVRILLAKMGHPILGDQRYGHQDSNRHFWEKYGLDRMFLHCEKIDCHDHTSGLPLTTQNALAPELATVLTRMGHHP